MLKRKQFQWAKFKGIPLLFIVPFSGVEEEAKLANF